jgi:hypothetical protein
VTPTRSIDGLNSVGLHSYSRQMALMTEKSPFGSHIPPCVCVRRITPGVVSGKLNPERQGEAAALRLTNTPVGVEEGNIRWLVTRSAPLEY